MRQGTLRIALVSSACGVSLGLFLGAPTAAHAQTSGRPAESSAATIDEIVVTAQRREERLQDVPIAIDAVGAEQLQARGIQKLEDLGGRMPGVYFRNLSVSAPQVFIRGIGTQQYDNSAEQPVGVFIDEVYVASIAGSPSDLYDVERVEVLKGPQGTLYGRNTIAGAINISTRGPTADPNAQIQVDLGDYHLIKLQGGFGGPLTETLQGRIGFLSSSRDGWTRNAITGRRANDDDTQALRGKLRWSATDRLEFNLSLDYTRNRLAGFDQKLLGTQNLGIAPPQSDPGPNQPYVSYSNVEGYQDRDLWGASLRTTYDLDRAVFTAISSYSNHRQNALRDLDMGPANLLSMHEDETGEEFSQELRLTSLGDTRLKWLGGLYFFRSNSDRTETWALSGLFPPFAFLEGDYFWSLGNKVTSYAAFAQVDYEVVERLNLILGLRYSHDSKDGDYSARTTAPFSLPSFISPTAGYVASVSRKWDSLDPSVTLNFHPTPKAILYVSYKQGFKSGGFQLRPATAALAGTPYDPENVKVVEAGAKTEWFDRRLIANLAVYHYDYRDLQLLGLVPGTIITFTDNAGTASVEGAELQLVAKPSPQLELGFGYAYNDAHYTDYVDSAGTQQRGKALSRAPRNSLNASAEYTIDLADSNTLRLRAEYDWRDEIYFNPANDPVSRDGPVGLLNIRASLDVPDKNLMLSLWGSNISGEEYCGVQVPSVPTNRAATCGVGAPRQFGLSVSWRYN